MPRIRRIRGGAGYGASHAGAGALDRPSRLLIFARRQRWLIKPALSAIVLLAAGGYALHVDHAMRSEQSFAPMRAQLGRVSGLRIDEIVVQGRDMQPEASVLDALGVVRGDALLGFSVEQARRRIDRLAFVEHATVERRLPGTVLVQLVERRPFAVWQNQGRFVLIDRPDADTAVLEVESGKGVYMRSLARDLAVGCGTVGHIAVLRRLRVGPFTEKQAIPLDKVMRTEDTAPTSPDLLLPVVTALADIPALALTEAEATGLSHGQAISLVTLMGRIPPGADPDGGLARAMAGGRVIGLCRLDDGWLKPERLL